MTRIVDRQEVIKLRKSGKTYSEIRNELGIPKSTLSDWLSKYPLTNEQIVLLEKSRKLNKYLGIEKVRLTKQRKREKRLNFVYEEEKKYWAALSKRELQLAGIFLYWGEGNKNLKGPLSLNNTDPKVVRFTLYWLVYVLRIPKEKIRVYLHLYKDMNIDQEIKYWSKALQLPPTQFAKPYIKESKRVEIDHKGFGHGTCGLQVSNVRLKEKVMMAIEAIADHYSGKI